MAVDFLHCLWKRNELFDRLMFIQYLVDGFLGLLILIMLIYFRTVQLNLAFNEHVVQIERLLTFLDGDQWGLETVLEFI